MVFNYSGRPWMIRDCASQSSGRIGCAAGVYKKFRHVILGARLEERSRSGHWGTKRLIGAIRATAPDTEVWGYISIVGSPKDDNGIHPYLYSARKYLRRAARWKKMGVTGIFVDEFDICVPSYETCQLGPTRPGVHLSEAPEQGRGRSSQDGARSIRQRELTDGRDG